MQFSNIPQPWAPDPARPSTLEDAPFSLRISALVAGGDVETNRGPIAVDDLQPGDEITMPGAGKSVVQALRRRTLSPMDLQEHPQLRPIRIDAGALSDGYPARATLVAPGQPLQRPVQAWDLAAIPGPARAYTLCNGGTIRPVIPEDGVTYVEVIGAPLATSQPMALHA